MKYVCTVCGYVYEGESLPADFVCPVCKAPASKFAAQTGEREWAAEHVVGVAKGVSAHAWKPLQKQEHCKLRQLPEQEFSC